MNVNIRVYGTINCLWMNEGEKDSLYSLIEDIKRSKENFYLQDDYYGKTVPCFDFDFSIESFGELSDVWKDSLPIPYYVIKMELGFKVDVSKTNITSSDPDELPVTDKIREEISTINVAEDAENLFRDIVTASNISSPGTLQISKLAIFTNNKYPVFRGGSVHPISDAKEKSLELEWPKLNRINISQVWKWLEGMEKLPDKEVKMVKRSVSALTHLFGNSTRDENDLGLVWALMGLESVYGKSNLGLKEQILSKSETLLGSREKNKKRYSWMYDYRSRLLHGDILSNPSYHSRWIDTHDIYDTEVYECQLLATSMLIATLQELCINNSYSVEFHYQPRFISA